MAETLQASAPIVSDAAQRLIDALLLVWSVPATLPKEDLSLYHPGTGKQMKAKEFMPGLPKPVLDRLSKP